MKYQATQIENQRVTTKLGGVMANNLVNPITGTLTKLEDDINVIDASLYKNLLNISCTEKIGVVIEPEFINTLNPQVCLLRKAGEYVSIGVACLARQTDLLGSTDRPAWLGDRPAWFGRQACLARRQTCLVRQTGAEKSNANISPDMVSRFF